MNISNSSYAYNACQTGKREAKYMRDFILTMGSPQSDYGRSIVIRARSSLEAGFNILQQNVIPPNMVAFSLVDTADKLRHKQRAVGVANEPDLSEAANPA